MTVDASDTLMRDAAFDHARRLCKVHDHKRIPLIKRWIFKPQQMCYLLSIKTACPKPAATLG